MLVVAFSGGKDSTVMALRLAELGEEFSLLHTGTGNELPGLFDHIDRVRKMTGAPLIDLEVPTLEELIEEQQCLPNFFMRWCTRIIKIESCATWLKKHPGAVLAVGLRYDEGGRLGGTYDHAEIIYPLRDWYWGLEEVVEYLKQRNIVVPERTDCAWCFFQTLHEWWTLWREHPDIYARGEYWEERIGHTFRSPGRDTHAAALKDLREEFESGWVPKKRKRKVSCRVCSM